MILRSRDDDAVLVAGPPGAGKSTLLARVAVPADARTLDTDPRRARWTRVLAPLPHARRPVPGHPRHPRALPDPLRAR